MRVVTCLTVVATLTGCASSAYQQKRLQAVDSMLARWEACMDSAAWQWFDDRNESAPEEVKRMRDSLSAGQMLVRSMDQCREHLASGEIEQWDQLSDSELRRFIRQGGKRFWRVRDEIALQRDLETI